MNLQNCNTYHSQKKILTKILYRAFLNSLFHNGAKIFTTYQNSYVVSLSIGLWV